MWTYSLVKSQVHTRAAPRPLCRSTTMGTFFSSRRRCAARSSSGKRDGIGRALRRPVHFHSAQPDFRMIGIEGNARAASGGEDAAPIGIGAGDGRLDERRKGRWFRPLASRPHRSARRALRFRRDAWRLRHPRRFQSPAPCKLFRAQPRISRNPRRSASVIFFAPLAPLASTSSVSLVEVSPSTVMQLNVRLTTSRSATSSTPGSIAASVTTKESIVAMLG